MGDHESFLVVPVDGMCEDALLSEAHTRLSNEVCKVVKPHLDAGDRVVKVVNCRRYYGAILLESGALVLFCPDVPTFNGTTVESGGELVVDVAAGESHFVFCTESGSVYTFGYSNRFGQLGDGSLWKGEPTSGSEPLPLSHPKRIPGFGDVVHVTGRTPSEHSSAENMYQDGENSFDEMNINQESNEKQDDKDQTQSNQGEGKSVGSKNFSRFVKGDISYMVDMNSTYPERDTVRIAAVACGLHHTLLMTSKRNAVYACGRGHCGQLSSKRMIPVQATFRSIRLLFGLPIRSITAAGHHSFVLLSTGKLLAFGENSCGQLGIGHCSKVFVPTSAAFLPEDRLFAAAFREGGAPAASKRLQDAKMYSTLRAAYSSYESTYFPMRVERIDSELASHEPFVIDVWTCETITVLLTSDLKWMSCGLPLSRSRGQKTNPGRFDGFGVLGRPLMTKEETYSFGYMHFSCAIRDKIKEVGYVFQGCSEEGPNVVPLQLPSTKRIECFCYPHTTVVKIPGPSSKVDQECVEVGEEMGRSTVFLQSNVVDALVEMNAVSDDTDESEGMYYATTLRHPDNEMAISNFVLRGKKEGGQLPEELDDDSTCFQLNSCITALPFGHTCVLM